MALSVDQLIVPPSADQIFETFLSILEATGISARSWRVGGVARSILRVVATSYAGFAIVMALAIRAMFLETATGDWLTLLARNAFGVVRREATFATGQVQLTNTGGGIYGYIADQIKFIRPSDGKAFTNTGTFTLNPGDVLLVDIRAVEVGAESSSGPGTITKLETFLAGVTCTNLAAVVGSDAETDDELRTACVNKRESISDKGPRGAYANAVRIATHLDGSPLNINRVSVSPSSSTGVVTVYCASPSGVPDAGDLALADASIQTNARPDSVTAITASVTAVPVSRALTVWARRVSGVDANGIASLADTALIKTIATYPIGGIPKPPAAQGYLYADYLAGIVEGAHASIYDVDGTGADVALSPGEVAILTTTINVRIVDVP